MCICVYVYMCICVYVYMCICVYVYKYMYIYIVYLSLYIYIYIYIYMHIHILATNIIHVVSASLRATVSGRPQRASDTPESMPQVRFWDPRCAARSACVATLPWPKPPQASYSAGRPAGHDLIGPPSCQAQPACQADCLSFCSSASASHFAPRPVTEVIPLAPSL